MGWVKSLRMHNAHPAPSGPAQRDITLQIVLEIQPCHPQEKIIHQGVCRDASHAPPVPMGTMCLRNARVRHFLQRIEFARPVSPAMRVNICQADVRELKQMGIDNAPRAKRVEWINISYRAATALGPLPQLLVDNATIVLAPASTDFHNISRLGARA